MPSGKRSIFVVLACIALAGLCPGPAQAQTPPRKPKVMIISLFALRLSSSAALTDSDKAAKYRANYPNAPANQPPKVIQCDTLAGDTYWHGVLIGERAHDWVALLTDGKGTYCTTQQEDNAIYEALRRGAANGLVDISRVADLRVAANFDRPYPGETADTSLHASSGGFPIACENIYRAGAPLVKDIVARWDQWEKAIPP